MLQSYLIVFAIYIFSNFSCFAATVPPSSEFSFKKLVDILGGEKKPSSIEALLPLLPREMTNNYVAVYKSRSLQEAHMALPRVIMFSQNAKLLLSFNASKKGFNNLEVIQYKNDTQSFELRDIQFDSHQSPVVSEANPRKCLNCHQSASRADVDPRPNWEPYNSWPGVYGSSDGYLSTVPYYNVDPDTPVSTEIGNLMDAGLDEMDGASDFAETYKSHPRYKFLGPPEFARYGRDKIIELTEALGNLNFKRVARLMRAHPLYPAYKYVVADGLLSFGVIDGFLRYYCPRIQFPESLNQSYAKYWPTWSGALSLPMDKPSVSQVLDQALQPLGIDTEDWSMDFQSGGMFAFKEDRFQIPNVATRSLLAQMAEKDPDLNELVTVKRTFNDEIKNPNISKTAYPKINFCQTVHARANELLTNRAAEFSSHIDEHLRHMEERPLRACINCHTGAIGREGIPVIHFNDPNLLAKELALHRSRRGSLLEEIKYRLSPEVSLDSKMAKGMATLHPKEAEAFISYLENLTK